MDNLFLVATIYAPQTNGQFYHIHLNTDTDKFEVRLTGELLKITNTIQQAVKYCLI